MDTSFNFLAERRHPFGQHRPRIFSGAAKFKRAEVFVPVAIGCEWVGPDPLLKPLEIRQRDLAILNAIEEMPP
jgi:hypothetical protein